MSVNDDCILFFNITGMIRGNYDLKFKEGAVEITTGHNLCLMSDGIKDALHELTMSMHPLTPQQQNDVFVCVCVSPLRESPCD